MSALEKQDPMHDDDPRWAYAELTEHQARAAWPCGDCRVRRDEHADQPEQSWMPHLDITDHSFVEAGCADLCVSCSSPVRTFANLQLVSDEKNLAPRWMPPGGCTCTSAVEDPECPLCSGPDTYLCRSCGDAAALASTSAGDHDGNAS